MKRASKHQARCECSMLRDESLCRVVVQKHLAHFCLFFLMQPLVYKCCVAETVALIISDPCFYLRDQFKWFAPKFCKFFEKFTHFASFQRHSLPISFTGRGTTAAILRWVQQNPTIARKKMVRREPVLLQKPSVSAETHAGEATKLVESSEPSESAPKSDDKKPKLDGEKPAKRHQRNKKHSTFSQQHDHKEPFKSRKHPETAKKLVERSSDGLEASSESKCKF